VCDGTEIYASLRNSAEGNLVAEDKATQRHEGVAGKPGRVGISTHIRNERTQSRGGELICYQHWDVVAPLIGRVSQLSAEWRAKC